MYTAEVCTACRKCHTSLVFGQARRYTAAHLGGPEEFVWRRF